MGLHFWSYLGVSFSSFHQVHILKVVLTNFKSRKAESALLQCTLSINEEDLYFEFHGLHFALED